jgi:TM2 domain-containing membrane protein YozV
MPTPPQQPIYNNDPFASGPEGKSRGVAALLAIVLGYLGIHYFYLGKNTAGLLTILILAVTCGAWSIIPLAQGIIMFCMNNEQFRAKYVTTPATFPLF